MIRIWNEIVDEGIAFPQEELLDEVSGAEFFAGQSYTGVAEEDGKILGLYILHPNNVGRCGHICNASYAVASEARGQHIGEKLVLDCIGKGCAIGDLRIGELKQYSPLFGEDIFEKITPEACIASKLSEGSTSYESVEKQLEQIKKQCE